MLGLGTDIIEINRIERACRKESFCKRVFTGAELAYAASRHKQKMASLAGIFAAKEAFVKALGLGMRLGSWQDMEVVHTNLGAPVLKVKDTFKEELEKRFGKAPSLYLSISHSQAYAVAQIIIEK
ncbi:MAG: holo-ACP synthase [Veillonellaceae bacterium]|nr:holo-ACP synthase [Veillonellaceae bacterium]